MREKSLTVVIPVYNETDNISEMSENVHKALQNQFNHYEILFIDDGSTDSTLDEIKKNSRKFYISLRKNFGQTTAMRIGIQSATTDLIAFLDGDLQNDPIDIPRMVDYLLAGNFDCVCGWRSERKDPFLKKFISNRARFLRNILIPDEIHDAGCTLKVMPTQVAKELNLIGEMHRFIPSLLVNAGFKITEVKVNHYPRKFGETKYNWKRMFKGYLDMIGLWFWGRYALRPLHFFGGISLLFVFVGITALLSSVFSFFFLNGKFLKILPLISGFLILESLLFLLIGLIAQLIVQQGSVVSENNKKLIKEKFIG